MAWAAAFALLSWGLKQEVRQFSPQPRQLEDIALHLAAGGLVGWLAGRQALARLGMLLSIGLDADHLGAALGLHVFSRGGHAAIFFLMSCLLFWLLGARRILRAAPPLLLALLVGAACLAHIGTDALIGEGDIPIWAPFSWKFVRFDHVQGAILLAGAAGLALWGGLWGRWEAGRTRRDG